MFDKLNGHPVMICLYAKMIPGANMTLQGVWDKITSLKHQPQMVSKDEILNKLKFTMEASIDEVRK